MPEQELKLHVPQDSRPGLEKALLRGAVKKVSLNALYFDTPSRDLVRAKIALRLRLEGDQWVQTLKMPGEHALSRLEINHNRPAPELDLTLYIGTPAAVALKKLSVPLGVCYQTQVQRVLRNVRTPLGLVEVAYDTGCLRAGGLELPISEIEFELKRGQLGALFLLGTRWQQAHGLILDARSKAERGDHLATLALTLQKIEVDHSAEQPIARQEAIATFWQARTAAPVMLEPHMTYQAGLAAVMTECLDQIIRNAAVLAEVDTLGICKAGAAEHVHQLRVGIRRMRSAWSYFNGLADLPSVTAREAIKQYFSWLGGTRDDDVLNETLLPLLQAAGQPPLILEGAVGVDQADAVARDPGFQAWLLEMLEFVTKPVATSVPPVAQVALSQDPQSSQESLNTTAVAVTPTATTEISPTSGAATPTKSTVTAIASTNAMPAAALPSVVTMPVSTLPSLKKSLILKLRKWHRQVLREGLKFEYLSIEERHALRKRAKRLRYALQFTEAMLPRERLRNYRKQLANVQDILGEMNDLAVARERFVGLRDTQPSAWFACGWITSRLDALTRDASAAFKQLSRTEHFWR